MVLASRFRVVTIPGPLKDLNDGTPINDPHYYIGESRDYWEARCDGHDRVWDKRIANIMVLGWYSYVRRYLQVDLELALVISACFGLLNWFGEGWIALGTLGSYPVGRVEVIYGSVIELIKGCRV